MNSEYVERQAILNKIINKIISSSNNVQAYLLVGENNYNLHDLAKTLSKVLICPNKYNNNCNKCNICKRIDDECYGELTIVNPTNNIIKKEEILNIRNKFQTYSLEGRNQVYIINNIEYLGQSAANSMLKFLEEPDSNTVAIFTTNSLNNVLDTIISRCQIIKLNSDEKNGMEFISNFCGCQDITKLSNYIDIAFEIEEKKYDYITNITKNKFLKIVANKEDLTILIKILLLVYKDMFNYINHNEFKYFKDRSEILNLVNSNNITLISNKIAFLLDNMKKINYNVNINLFINNLIIGIGDIDNDKSNRN